MTRRQLTPVTVTARYPNIRTGRPEIWSADSRDGHWTYDRTEITGTPWIVQHRETGEERWFGTLGAARAATANGWGADLAVCPDCDIRGGHDDKCPALT